MDLKKYMLRTLCLTPLLLFLVYLILCPECLYAYVLEPKVGVRPMGMSAFSAVADDINAISWNPAGLPLLSSKEFTATYAPLYGFSTDINQSYLAYAHALGKWGTIGIDFSYLNYGNMDWRDDTGIAIGSFARKDYSAYASYGISLMKSLSLGVSAGVASIRTNLSEEGSATGMGIDMGALYTIANRAGIGLCIENIGGVSAGDREIARQKIRAGTAVLVINRENTGLTLALDLEEQQGKLDTLYSGVEWAVLGPSNFFAKRKIHERYITLKEYEGIADYMEGLPKRDSRISLYLRGGSRKRLAVDEPFVFSGGFCIKYAVIPRSMTLRIEHAFMLHPYLETTHRFSVGLEMGKLVYN